MNLPTDPSISYVAVVLFLLGLFLFISGLNIIKIEKITVSRGFKTWATGVVLMGIGGFLGMPQIIENRNMSSSISPNNLGKNQKINTAFTKKYNSATNQLADFLGEISNHEMTVQQIKQLLKTNRKSLGYSSKIFPKSNAEALEKYKLATIRHDNSKKFPSKNIIITPLGEQVYDSIINQFVKHINYAEELEPITIPDGSLKFPNIKTSLNGLSGNDIVNLFIKNYGFRKHKEEEYQKRFIKNGLKTVKILKKETHKYSYDLTDLGKEVVRQLSEILKDRLQLKS